MVAPRRFRRPLLDAVSDSGPAPYDPPGYMPQGIQNLPPLSSRPMPLNAIPPTNAPLALERPFPVRDAHRYATLIEVQAVLDGEDVEVEPLLQEANVLLRMADDVDPSDRAGRRRRDALLAHHDLDRSPPGGRDI